MIKGDLIAFESKGTMQNLISFFQKIDFLKGNQKSSDKINHIGFYFKDGFFVESTIYGVRLSLVKNIKGVVWYCPLKRDIRLKIQENENLFDEFIMNQIGKKYDFLQIGKQALRIGTLGLYTPKEDDSLTVCSELYYAVMEKVGVVGKIKNSAVGTPADVINEDWYSYKVRL